MANTAQARKRARQSLVRRGRNVAFKSKLRTHIKNTVKAIASTGVNRISVGSITHSAPAVDFKLEI